MQKCDIFLSRVLARITQVGLSHQLNKPLNFMF